MDPPGPPCTLSIHRAFVVRLYTDLDVVHARVAGRVEHVVSGEGGEFHSVEELLQFMAHALDARHQNAREDHAEEE